MVSYLEPGEALRVSGRLFRGVGGGGRILVFNGAGKQGGPLRGPYCPGLRSGEKRHININFLLWLTSRWPWDKRLVVPGLTGPKSFCVASKHRKYKFFLWLTGRLSQGCPDFQKVYVFQSLCAFFLPYKRSPFSRMAPEAAPESSPRAPTLGPQIKLKCPQRPPARRPR